MSICVNLDKAMFSEREKLLLENGDVSASVFLYDTGVHALRIANKRGEIVMLPYQGQQIWSCTFEGKELTMKSMFTKPYPTREYLGNYGGFLLHCGATAMGVPSKEDAHPLHGELPNAPYPKAYLKTGEDERGRYIGLGGSYEHIVAFNHHYIAEPFVRIEEDSSLVDVSMSITNLKSKEMELMYMMHVNFRPVDNAELIYSAHPTPEKVKTHVNIPSHMQSTGTEKLVKFLRDLEVRPELHHVLKPDLIFDPEIVFTIRYEVDSDGNAHSMMVHPDGYASYMTHKPRELEFGIRWISRSGDQDALGLVLPATAEHKGYCAEKAKGHIKIIPSGGKISFHAKAGLLRPSEAEGMRKRISDILLSSS